LREALTVLDARADCSPRRLDRGARDGETYGFAPSPGVRR